MILESKRVIVLCLYVSIVGKGDNAPTVQRTETKEVENEFLGLLCDILTSFPNDHARSLREIIIYCVPTVLHFGPLI